MRITLSNGQVVEVRSVPPLAIAAISARLPEDYTPRQREAAIQTAAWSMAFPELDVPRDWQIPQNLRRAGIEPREGDVGRFADYVEYELLTNSEDVAKAQAVMWEGVVTEAEVAAVEAVFRSDRRWQTTTGDPVE